MNSIAFGNVEIYAFLEKDVPKYLSKLEEYIEDVRSLNISSKRIYDYFIANSDKMTKLTHLTLLNKSLGLANLSVSFCPALIDVEITGEINILNISPRNTNIKKLFIFSSHLNLANVNLGSTQLEKLDLAGVTIEGSTNKLAHESIITVSMCNCTLDCNFISKLPNLKDLTIRSTEISTLPNIMNPEKLSYLSIAYTQITSIEFVRQFVNLAVLILHDTDVDDLGPVAALRELTFIHFSSTKVKNVLPLTGLPNLEEIYMDDTDVSDISCLDGLNLVELSASETLIRDFSIVSKMEHLTRLNLSSNEIRSLSFFGNKPKMLSLRLAHNRLSSIGELGDMLKINSIDVSHNYITDMRPLLKYHATLQYCYVDHNYVLHDCSGLTKNNIRVWPINKRMSYSADSDDIRDRVNGIISKMVMNNSERIEGDLTEYAKSLVNDGVPNKIVKYIKEDIDDDHKTCKYSYTEMFRYVWPMLAMSENKELMISILRSDFGKTCNEGRFCKMVLLVCFFYPDEYPLFNTPLTILNIISESYRLFPGMNDEARIEYVQKPINEALDNFIV